MTHALPRFVTWPALAGALVFAGCTGAADEPIDGSGAGAGPDATATVSSSSTAASSSSAGGGGASSATNAVSVGVGGIGAVSSPCPEGMAKVGSFCMDRYEAPNEKGAKPLVMQSAITAAAWCKMHDKRLCDQDEWEAACEGPNHWTYPYGNTHVTSRCNDDKLWKVVNEKLIATWPSAAAKAEVDKLYQAAPSGSYAECVSADGIYDLTGNVEEWTVRTKPSASGYPHVLKGCYWASCYGGSKPTCGWNNPAHADGFMFYETGFRCCRDLP